MNRIEFRLLLMFLFLFPLACEKERPDVPTTSTEITITTQAPTNISYRNAEITGSLSETFGQTVQDYGHCWDTLQNPTRVSHQTSFGSQKGSKSFNSQLTSLDPGKNYYVRAWFMIDDTAIYSPENSFTTKTPGIPEVRTDSIIVKSVVSMEIQGSVMQVHDDSLVERGICWNTTGNPTFEDSIIANGNESGGFTCTINELSLSTNYYFRAYAKNTFNTGYGEIKTITTSTGLPEVTTTEATNITFTSAESGGSIVSDGGFPVTERGICWSTSPNPTISDIKTSDGVGTDSFTSQITGLTENTTYYVRAWATNEIGTSYGEERSFTTKNGIIQLSTAPVTNITVNSATSGGNISDDGGSPVTARGVCWSTSPNPTVSDNKTTDESGTGNYSSQITGLNENTTYHVRAYATNFYGTQYGENFEFVAKESVSGTFTDSRDGNTYDWVKIGNQVWMAKNLAWLPTVSPPTSESYTEPYYYVYGYSGNSVSAAKATSNYATYGVLYNWPAALNACPQGWHLPTDAEWTTLENYLIANGYNYDGSTSVNKIGKALTSAQGWSSSSLTGAVGNTDYPEKRNASGFSALPGGYRYINGNFGDAGNNGSWWSAAESGSSDAWFRRLHFHSSDLLRYDNYREYGFSVRCLRDN